MTQLYVWQPSQLSAAEANARFARCLEEQCSFYNGLLSTRCTPRYGRVGTILVGQINSDLGIHDWMPWQEQDGRGVAWSGVCEDFLGVALDETHLTRLAAEILEAPHKLTDLMGSFSVCAWDTHTEHVAIMTSATQPQTLWQTEGPSGLAIGSRANVILDLVGRDKELDKEEASVFIAYNYLINDGALFRHVRRIPARRHVRLAPNQPLRSAVYVKLGDYLGSPSTTNFDEAVGICAEHLKDRVARQLRFSRDPVLHLTGGRDSRLIAAALSYTPSPPPASTMGALSSVDVRTASMVANRLGFRHITPGPDFNTEDLLSPLATARPRVHLWTRMSEGIETLRHAMYLPDFFTSTRPFPPQIIQGFNGFHVGLQKPSIISEKYSPAGLNELLGPHFRYQTAVRDRFEQMRATIATELRDLDAPSSRWTELYYWQRGELHWGQDNFLVKDLFYWFWTPLFDKLLIQTGWHLPPQYQASMHFVEGITLQLRNDLEGIPFDTEQTLIKRAQRRLQRTIRRFLSPISKNKLLDTQTIWETVLYNSPHPSWTELVDEQFVRHAIQGRYSSEVLWRVATIQLFIEAWDLHG